MAIVLPGAPDFFGKNSLGSTFRTDIFKFRDLNLVTEAGAPVGQFDKGALFANLADYKLYLSVNYKEDYTPDVAWYKFDGSGNDSSGNGYTATMSNITYPTGKYSNAALLNGTDGKITLSGADINIQPLADSTEPTISFWIKFSGIETPGDEVFVLERYTDANNYLRIGIKNQAGVYGVNFKWNTPTGGIDTTDTTVPLEADTWTHIIFMGTDEATSTLHNLYINGGAETGFSAAQDPGPAFVGDEDWTIGYSTLDSSYGDGSFMIDDLKIWTTDRGSNATNKYFETTSLEQNDWRVFTGTFTKAV